MRINIRKFDLDQIGSGVYLLVGLRGTGKYIFTCHLLEHKQYQTGIFFSSIVEHDPTLCHQYCPYLYVFEQYTPKILVGYIDRIHHKKSVDQPSVINFDHYRGEASITSCPAMKQLLTDSKSLNSTTLLTMMIPERIPYHTHIDYVFIFMSSPNRRRLYVDYGQLFESYEQFEKILLVCTKRYGCLVINNHPVSDQLCENIYWYRVSEEEFYHLIGEEMVNMDLHVDYSRLCRRTTKSVELKVNDIPEGETEKDQGQ